MTKKITKNSLSLATIFLLSSCSLFIEPLPKGWDWDKRVLTGVRNFPPATTDYGRGFKDGCYAAYDVGAKGYLSDAARSTFDVKRSQKSAEYTTGWWDGHEQCFYIIDWDTT